MSQDYFGNIDYILIRDPYYWKDKLTQIIPKHTNIG